MPRTKLLKHRDGQIEVRTSLDKPGLVHVEIPNGIVNIRVGLRDDAGRSVDAIEIIADSTTVGDHPIVVLDGSVNSRLVRANKGEALPLVSSGVRVDRAPGVRDPANMTHSELADLVRTIQSMSYYDHDEKAWDLQKECRSAPDFVGDVCSMLIDYGLAPAEKAPPPAEKRWTNASIRELAESWINGNKGTVLDEIEALPAIEAAYVATKLRALTRRTKGASDPLKLLAIRAQESRDSK